MMKLFIDYRQVCFLILLLLHSHCDQKQENLELHKFFEGLETVQEIQLTSDSKGHFLNQRQAFSFDDKLLAFDNRNDDTKIGENSSVQIIHLETGKVETVYSLENPHSYGPGVGAVSFHPLENRLVFIHGLKNASAEKPYSITRRFAMQIDLNEEENAFPLEARDSREPFSKGALRGGSHAYSYSTDGKLVSFTYNDEILEMESQKNPEVSDLRTVGAFITDHPTSINGEKNEENFDGTGFAILIARVTANPRKGSDEISKAYEECWVGKNGYKKKERNIQKRALAYLGDVLSESGEKVTEVFISDIPENLDSLIASTDAGTQTSLPSVPKAVIQRRLTFTSTDQFPGIQGPRQWLRSSPDGSQIYFYRKDPAGLVQIYAVSPNGGKIIQITNNVFSADTSFDLSFDGKFLAYGAEESIYITEIETGKTIQVSSPSGNSSSDLCNINWANQSYTLAFNRKVKNADGYFFQIFTLSLSNESK